MVNLICGKEHIVEKALNCPYCGEPLVWANRYPGRSTVLVCRSCWKEKAWERNITIGDVVSFLGLKKCPKCNGSQFFFVKKN